MQEWMDERLSWTPNKHNNMTEIIVEARKLWKPELAVINGYLNCPYDVDVI